MLTAFILGVLFAFLTSFFFALNSIATRRGVLTGYIFPSVFISLLVGIPMYIILLPFCNDINLLPKVTFYSLLPFIISGVINYAIGRYTLYSAIHYIGSAISVPIITTSQIIAAFIAIPLLHESVTLSKILGLIISMIGVLLIASLPSNIRNFRLGVSLAILSAFMFAFAALIIRWGLIIFNAPIIGVITSYISATITYTILMLTNKPKNLSILKIPKSVAIYIIPAGFLVNLGQLFKYLSLNLVEIGVYAPLLATYPLQTILYSYITNRDIEIINLRVVIGTIMIFLGIIFVFNPIT